MSRRSKKAQETLTHSERKILDTILKLQKLGAVPSGSWTIYDPGRVESRDPVGDRGHQGDDFTSIVLEKKRQARIVWDTSMGLGKNSYYILEIRLSAENEIRERGMIPLSDFLAQHHHQIEYWKKGDLFFLWKVVYVEIQIQTIEGNPPIKKTKTIFVLDDPESISFLLSLAHKRSMESFLQPFLPF